MKLNQIFKTEDFAREKVILESKLLNIIDVASINNEISKCHCGDCMQVVLIGFTTKIIKTRDIRWVIAAFCNKCGVDS
jgi:RNase P subunit RPR2